MNQRGLRPLKGDGFIVTEGVCFTARVTCLVRAASAGVLRTGGVGTHKVFKNMNPGIFHEIHKWDTVDIEDKYLIPMVPLIRRRLSGERIWVNSAK